MVDDANDLDDEILGGPDEDDSVAAGGDLAETGMGDSGPGCPIQRRIARDRQIDATRVVLRGEDEQQIARLDARRKVHRKAG